MSRTLEKSAAKLRAENALEYLEQLYYFVGHEMDTWNNEEHFQCPEYDDDSWLVWLSSLAQSQSLNPLQRRWHHWRVDQLKLDSSNMIRHLNLADNLVLVQDLMLRHSAEIQAITALRSGVGAEYQTSFKRIQNYLGVQSTETITARYKIYCIELDRLAELHDGAWEALNEINIELVNVAGSSTRLDTVFSGSIQRNLYMAKLVNLRRELMPQHMPYRKSDFWKILHAESGYMDKLADRLNVISQVSANYRSAVADAQHQIMESF